MSAVMGFYTENKSSGTGAFHEGHWKKDTARGSEEWAFYITTGQYWNRL